MPTLELGSGAATNPTRQTSAAPRGGFSLVWDRSKRRSPSSMMSTDVAPLRRCAFGFPPIAALAVFIPWMNHTPAHLARLSMRVFVPASLSISTP